jgi:hypothetical protein
MPRRTTFTQADLLEESSFLRRLAEMIRLQPDTPLRSVNATRLQRIAAMLLDAEARPAGNGRKTDAS